MLSKQRQRIDELDRELVRIFEERTKVTEEVAGIKLAKGMEILDSSREKQVIEKVQGYLNDDSLRGELADLYENLMRISRGHQKNWMEKQNNQS